MTKRKLRVGLISSYVPKKCGIATYSRDLIEAMNNHEGLEWCLIAAEDANESHSYGNRAIAIIKKDDQSSYVEAARAMNTWQPDIILLQHEYGLYGGDWVDFDYRGVTRHDPTGDYILTLINALSAPIVTTLHTVIRKPDAMRLRVMRTIDDRSSKLIAMTDDAREIIHKDYGIDSSHIVVIPHGVHPPGSRDKQLILEELKLDRNRFYLLITGLIGPNKGIDVVIRALPAILKNHPEVVLLVVGQTHPDILLSDGEAYRESMVSLAKELGVDESLRFVNKYLPTNKLVDYFTIADIYLTIHSDPEQSASGTLAYALGCGLVAVSTPYRYAVEVLADGRGFLVPFDSPPAIAAQINSLIGDEALRYETQQKALEFGSSTGWSQVGGIYLELLVGIINSKDSDDVIHDNLF